MSRRRCVVAAALAALAAPAPAAQAQAPPAPSLTADAAFSPPNGVSRIDFIPGTVADIPAAVAVHGDRIYTVGRTQGGAGGQDVGIVAQRPDGTLDAGFSGDGKLAVPIAPATEADIGTGLVVLPDGRLRVIAATDRVAGSGESLDVAIVGVQPDGSPDTAFGDSATGGGRTGTTVFAAGPSSDVPARIVAGADGRLAIVGSRSDGSRDDLFVSLREPDGSPVASFGDNGVRFLDRGGVANGASLIDRGVDVVFRPGGGLVALALVETNPGAATDFTTVLRAFTATGQDDPTFDGDGDLVLDVGEPDTVPGGLLEHRGHLWVTGSTRAGGDTDAFLARVRADGSDPQFRRFDMRGRLPATAQVVSRGVDLAVAPGDPETLVVAGAVDYGAETGSTTTDWAAAAFNAIDGDLAATGYGDVVLPAPGQGSLVSVAPGGDRWVAVAGAHVDSSISDNSFGTARLVIDAEKACDLAISVAEPAELVFDGLRPASLGTSVTNVGSRSCAGQVQVAAPFRATATATGRLAPGQRLALAPVTVTDTGARRAEDLLRVSVTAPGDANAANDRAAAHVLFRYCDLQVSPVGRAGVIPSEGARRFDVTLRNRGTTACRVRVGSAPAYTVAAGRSVSDRLAASAPSRARVGARVRVALRAGADDDVDPANNRATVAPTVVRVGDSRIARAGALRIGGTASPGAGRLRAAARRVARVDVAIARTDGGRCRWLRSVKGGFTTRKGGCAAFRWLRARGAGAWRLRLPRPLPAGRYVAYSRATIGAGFPEARFGPRDANRRRFRVR